MGPAGSAFVSAVTSASRALLIRIGKSPDHASQEFLCGLVFCILVLCGGVSVRADAPQPQQGDWVVKDFRFHTGEVLPELKLHYVTIGAPTGEPVLVLHGSTGSSQGMLSKSFAANCSGLARRSMRPSTSSSFRMRSARANHQNPPMDCERDSPSYNYDDMVLAQYRLLTEHLGVRHLKLVIGQSMGGMHAWMWGEMYPDFVRCWCPWRRSRPRCRGPQLDSAPNADRNDQGDPAYNNGNYTEQPPSFKLAQVSSAWRQAAAPRRSTASRRRVPRPTSWSTSGWRSASPPMPTIASTPMTPPRDYDPAPQLEKIKARVLAINSADDERNPAELGIMEREIKRVKNGRFYLVPASAETCGHGTTSNAKFWKHLLPGLLNEASLPGQ